MPATATSHLPRKSIRIPASLPLDISRFLAIVDHPLMQCLRERKQLGVNYLVFPGAVHTRFEHVLGVLGLTHQLCQIQDIHGDDRRHLCAYALLHDIGHGPFSHQIEPIIGADHNQHGNTCLLDMRLALEACDLDPHRIARLFAGEDNLSSLVRDRNLGSDKLDYLRRDALHIGFSGMPDVDTIQLATVIENGVPAVEEKFIEDIKRVQKFYSYLHQHGYLNKTALSVQRVFQRAVQEELVASGNAPASLWPMTDQDLVWWLRHGRSALARRLLATLADRGFHRSVLVIKPAGYGFVERQSRKDISICEWPIARLRTFTDICEDVTRLLALEDALAASLGLDRGEVLFAAMPFFVKLIPKDVRIYSSGASGSFWLFEKDRDHYQSVKGDYLRTFAVRVIVPPARREALLRRVAEITCFIEQAIHSGTDAHGAAASLAESATRSPHGRT